MTFIDQKNSENFFSWREINWKSGQRTWALQLPDVRGNGFGMEDPEVSLKWKPKDLLALKNKANLLQWLW